MWRRVIVHLTPLLPLALFTSVPVLDSVWLRHTSRNPGQVCFCAIRVWLRQGRATLRHSHATRSLFDLLSPGRPYSASPVAVAITARLLNVGKNGASKLMLGEACLVSSPWTGLSPRLSLKQPTKKTRQSMIPTHARIVVWRAFRVGYR